MHESILGKKPAFFPFVSAEIFFEADAITDLEGLNDIDIDIDIDLESELDELLGV